MTPPSPLYSKINKKDIAPPLPLYSSIDKKDMAPPPSLYSSIDKKDMAPSSPFYSKIDKKVRAPPAPFYSKIDKKKDLPLPHPSTVRLIKKRFGPSMLLGICLRSFSRNGKKLLCAHGICIMFHPS